MKLAREGSTQDPYNICIVISYHRHFHDPFALLSYLDVCHDVGPHANKKPGTATAFFHPYHLYRSIISPFVHVTQSYSSLSHSCFRFIQRLRTLMRLYPTSDFSFFSHILLNVLLYIFVYIYIYLDF